MTDKSLYQIALTRIKGVGVTHARALMQGWKKSDIQRRYSGFGIHPRYPAD